MITSFQSAKSIGNTPSARHSYKSPPRVRGIGVKFQKGLSTSTYDKSRKSVLAEAAKQPNIQYITQDFSQKFQDFVRENTENPYTNYEQVSNLTAEFLKKNLPDTILKILGDMSKGGKETIVVLKNLPVKLDENALPPTPSDDREDFEKDYVSEYFLLGLAKLMGKPYLMVNEKDGQIIQQIVPSDPKAKSSAGSKEPFEYHTENAHEENPPKIFMLSCIRGDKNANTTYYSLDDLLDNISIETIDELQKPNFLLKTGSVSNTDEFLKTAVLKKNDAGEFEVQLNTAPGRAEGTTDSAETALEEVKDFFASHTRPSVNLEQGDTLILQNKRMFHGRDAFEVSTTQEERRWLQREYVSEDPNSKL